MLSHARTESEMIREWNGSTDSASLETALIVTYLNRLKKFTFEDELGENYSSLPSRWIENHDQVNNSGWFDDVTTEDKVESYDDIAQIAIDLSRHEVLYQMSLQITSKLLSTSLLDFI